MTQTQFAMAWLLKIEKVAGAVFGVRDSTQLEGIHSYKTMDFNQKVLDQIREFADSDKVVAISEKMPEVYFEK
jgi:aryl-alcohol dehydrogenase-like predicted oxidoreductase